MLPIFGSRAGGRKLYYTADLPSFQRDFASLKTLDHGTGPNITFTRGSNATYFDADGTLQTASNDVARFDHSTDGSSLGLLIEEARTNLLEHSAEFDDAYWAKTTTTVTADDATSPDGTATADLVEKTGNETTTPAKTLAVTAVAHTASVFVKNSSGNRFRLRIDATGGTVVDAIFNTATGAVVSSSAGVTATITDVGNGWYRCAATYTFASAVNATIGFSPRNEGADATGAKAWLWGAQLEAGAFPTSYIPTTTAAATRAADSAVVTPISSFYNQAEGTLFGEAQYLNSDASLISVDDGTGGNRMVAFIRKASTTALPALVRSSASDQSTFSNQAYAAGFSRVILAYKTNDLAATVNGLAVQTDTSATIPAVTTMRFGSNMNPAFMNGHIRKIAYWPKRLTDTLLEQLTT